jgi:hypothetical protein
MFQIKLSVNLEYRIGQGPLKGNTSKSPNTNIVVKTIANLSGSSIQCSDPGYSKSGLWIVGKKHRRRGIAQPS